MKLYMVEWAEWQCLVRAPSAEAAVAACSEDVDAGAGESGPPQAYQATVTEVREGGAPGVVWYNREPEAPAEEAGQ